MGGHPDAVMEEFHRFLRPTDVYLFTNECPGYAVEMFVELDVIIDVDTGLLPTGKLIGLGWQGVQRRLVQALKEFSPRLPQMAHRAMVQFLQ